jgi:hypothetical protein
MRPLEWMVRRLVLPLLCLLPFAASAPAEGAWVLWAEVQTGSVRGLEAAMKIEAAFDTRQACEQSRGAILDRMRARPDSVVRQQTSEVLLPGSITRYVCLPDTVDPRGPKGE